MLRYDHEKNKLLMNETRNTDKCKTMMVLLKVLETEISNSIKADNEIDELLSKCMKITSTIEDLKSSQVKYREEENLLKQGLETQVDENKSFDENDIAKKIEEINTLHTQYMDTTSNIVTLKNELSGILSLIQKKSIDKKTEITNKKNLEKSIVKHAKEFLECEPSEFEKLSTEDVKTKILEEHANSQVLTQTDKEKEKTEKDINIEKISKFTSLDVCIMGTKEQLKIGEIIANWVQNNIKESSNEETILEELKNNIPIFDTSFNVAHAVESNYSQLLYDNSAFFEKNEKTANSILDVEKNLIPKDKKMISELFDTMEGNLLGNVEKESVEEKINQIFEHYQETIKDIPNSNVREKIKDILGKESSSLVSSSNRMFHYDRMNHFGSINEAVSNLTLREIGQSTLKIAKEDPNKSTILLSDIDKELNQTKEGENSYDYK